MKKEFIKELLMKESWFRERANRKLSYFLACFS